MLGRVVLRLVAALICSASIPLAVAQVASPQDPTTSTWDHNGSLMRMEKVANGNILVTYLEPRAGIRKYVKPGTKLLVFRTEGIKVRGRARVFRRGCAPALYDVWGEFHEDSGKQILTMRGAAPIREGCAVVGYDDQSSNAELIFRRDVPTNPAKIARNTIGAPAKPKTLRQASSAEAPSVDSARRAPRHKPRPTRTENSANRFALVFGISNYAKLQNLGNPSRDANAISELLGKHGFKVHKYLDPSFADFRKILANFKATSKHADQVIVFYAGHGMTVLQDNRLVNALAATDANLNCETRQGERMIAMREILDAIAHIPNQVLLFDSCRDDPLTGCRSTPLTAALKGFQPPEIGDRRIGGTASGPSRSAVQGNVGSDHRRTILVGYATSLGKTALDGEENGHSPFTTALLAELATKPNLPLREVLDHTSRKVVSATKSFQVPWVVTQGGEPNICLSGSCATRANLSASVLSGDASLLIERGTTHLDKQDFETALVLGAEGYSAAMAADDDTRKAAAHDLVQSALRLRMEFQIVQERVGKTLRLSLGHSGRFALSLSGEAVPVKVEPGGWPYYKYTEPPETGDIMRPDFDQWRDGKRINARIKLLKSDGRSGASSVRTVRVWDIENKQQVFFRRDYQDEIIAAYLRDAQGEVVVVHESGRVIVQPFSASTPRLDIRVSSTRVAHVATSPDGRYIAIGVPDNYKPGHVAQFEKHGYMAVLDLQAGAVIAQVPVAGGTLESVALGPKGKVLSTEFGTVFSSSEESAPSRTPGSVWSIEQGARLFSLPLVKNGSRLHVISDDGRWFARTSQQNRVEVWSIEQRKMIGQIDHPGGVSSLAIHSRKALGASIDTGGDIRIWRIGRDEKPRWLKVSGGYATKIVFSHDGESIFAAAGPLIQRLDIKTGTILTTVSVHGDLPTLAYSAPRNHVGKLALAKDRDVLLASYDRQIRLYKSTMAEADVFVGHRYHNRTSFVGFSRDGARLVESTMDALRVYDAHSLKLISAPRIGAARNDKLGNGSLGLFPEWVYGPGARDGSVAFKVYGAPSERFSDRVALGDLASLKPNLALVYRGYSVWGAALSPNGRKVAAALVPFGPIKRVCNDHKITIRNLRTKAATDFCGVRVGTHASPVFSPDSEKLAVVSQQGELTIFDLKTSSKVSVQGVFTPAVQPVFSHDSASLFASRGRSILELNATNGTVQRKLPSSTKSTIMSLAISHDGNWLASAETQAVRIWSVKSGLVLQSIAGPQEKKLLLNMSKGAFDANAERIVFGSSFWNRVVRVFKAPEITMARARKTMPGCLSKESRDRLGLQSEPPDWCATLGRSYQLPDLN